MIARRFLLTAGAALAAWPVSAQTGGGWPRVALQTRAGLILLDLRVDRAPITTANFLRYVGAGYYDGASCYRAARAAGSPGAGLIEGGVQNDPARLFPPIPHESTTATGLMHGDGVISMARNAPGTATGDFFICSGDAAYLDAHPTGAGDNLGYAAFGRVVDGMDVVRTILAGHTAEQARSPVMRGQMLDPAISIFSARRL